MNLRLLLIGCSLGLLGIPHAATPAELDLKGAWQLRLDREGSGSGETWWKEDFKERVKLPGSLTAQGFGDEVGPNTPWVGKGRLLVSSIDFEKNVDQRPAARQMKYSLLKYIAGDDFQPKVEVDVDALRALVKPESQTGLQKK